MGHPWFVGASANSRFLTGLLARFGMTKVWRACGTTEVVPFPVVALPKILERWGRGIPPFGFAQGRLLRKVREGWGTLGSWWLRLNSRFLTGLSARFGMTKVSK